MILVSSDQMTLLQSSIVQCSYWCTNSIHCLQCCGSNKGFLIFLFAVKPSSLRIFLTLSADNEICMSFDRWFLTLMAVFRVPLVTFHTIFRFVASETCPGQLSWSILSHIKLWHNCLSMRLCLLIYIFVYLFYLVYLFIQLLIMLICLLRYNSSKMHICLLKYHSSKIHICL